MIKYLFTRNDLIGSKLISSTTKRDYQTRQDTPSHFAILLADRWVLHSNFANGVHIEPYYFFKKKNKVIASFRKAHCEMSHTECILMFDELISKIWGSGYDFLAISYHIWRIGLKWAFNMDMPTKNRWESKNKWFCNEIFESILGEDLSMKTPNDLMWILLEHPDFTNCEVFA